MIISRTKSYIICTWTISYTMLLYHIADDTVDNIVYDMLCCLPSCHFFCRIPCAWLPCIRFDWSDFRLGWFQARPTAGQADRQVFQGQNLDITLWEGVLKLESRRRGAKTLKRCRLAAARAAEWMNSVQYSIWCSQLYHMSYDIWYDIRKGTGYS